MRWQFTCDEFRHLWNGLGHDRVPAPLTLRTEPRSRDEWNTRVAEIGRRLSPSGDPSLSAALSIAADPASAVTVIGTNDQPIRLYCAVTDQHAVGVAQEPGPAPDRGGDVVVRIGTPAALPTWIGHFTGGCAGGAGPALCAPVDELTSSRQALGLDYGESTPGDQLRKLLRRPRTGQGHVEVEEYRHHPDGPQRYYLSWLDIAGDGRYLYRYRDGELHLEPAPPEYFTTRLHRVLGLGRTAGN